MTLKMEPFNFGKKAVRKPYNENCFYCKNKLKSGICDCKDYQQMDHYARYREKYG